MKRHTLYFVIIIFSGILIASCSLSRNNPLDPLGNPDVFTPPMVQLDSLNTNTNIVKWFVGRTQEDSLADGYYIYAAFQENYYGTFDRVGININAYDTTFNKNDISHQYVWFKISSYNVFEGDTLEGKYSNITQ